MYFHLRDVSVRRAEMHDLAHVGEINRECFYGNGGDREAAEDWMRNRLQDPVFRIWVADIRGIVAGYVVWEILGGWYRPYPVVELEQIGVLERYRRNGIGRALISNSLPDVGQWIRDTNVCSGEQASIVVWTAEVSEFGKKLYGNFFPQECGSREQYHCTVEKMLRGTILVPKDTSW